MPITVNLPAWVEIELHLEAARDGRTVEEIAIEQIAAHYARVHDDAQATPHGRLRLPAGGPAERLTRDKATDSTEQESAQAPPDGAEAKRLGLL